MKKLTINYFVWGKINNEHKSFYLNPNQLEGFMNSQNLSDRTKKQVYDLQHCQGLELARGFTIERRIVFNQ